jgi:hypothetical protein
MARVLYLHGGGGGPFGRRLSWLEAHGHPVVARPSLPYPRHRRWSWRWFAAFCDRRWFGQAVEAAQQAYDRARPDVFRLYVNDRPALAALPGEEMFSDLSAHGTEPPDS